MRGRVEAICPGNRVFVSTFHSLGARLLRQYADRLGIDKNFTIYDVDDRNKLVKDALEATGIDNIKFTPDRLAGAISKAKNALQTPKDAALSSVQATSPSGSGAATATSGATGSTGSGIQLTACAASQSAVAQTMVQLRRISGVSGSAGSLPRGFSERNF